MRNVFGIIVGVFALSAVSGCGLFRDNIRSDIRDMQKGPEATPTRNITSFSSALRCMDNMMIDYGVRDLRMLVEDLDDRTGDVKAGTKDMLLTAMSDMTRRSRAVNLIAYGNDSGNIVAFLNAAGQQGAFKDVPQYDIRGSITQLDKDVISKQGDVGAAGDTFGGGLGLTAKGSVLGVDLNMLRTSDLSIIPGVSSRNSIIFTSSGIGGDIDATIKKAGVNFSFSISRTEGKSQALRNLVELASIELMGRLNKMPYWSCLGIDPQSEEIVNEVADWYYSLEANNELVAYLQTQLRLRGYYNGPINNETNPALERAVLAYKQDLASKDAEYVKKLEMSSDAQMDERFFTALLNKHMKAPKNVASTSPAAASMATAVATLGDGASLPATSTASAKTTASAQNSSNLNVTIEKPRNIDVQSKENSATQVKNGNRLNFIVKSPQDAYLYCFYRDDENKIMRIYPNRFKKDSFISANEEVQIPGTMPFQIATSSKGIVEKMNCFTTSRDILNDLPVAVKVTDFVKLEVNTLDDVKKTIQQVAGNQIGEFAFDIKVQ